MLRTSMNQIWVNQFVIFRQKRNRIFLRTHHIAIYSLKSWDLIQKSLVLVECHKRTLSLVVATKRIVKIIQMSDQVNI